MVGVPCSLIEMKLAPPKSIPYFREFSYLPHVSSSQSEALRFCVVEASTSVITGPRVLGQVVGTLQLCSQVAGSLQVPHTCSSWEIRCNRPRLELTSDNTVAILNFLHWLEHQTGVLFEPHDRQQPRFSTGRNRRQRKPLRSFRQRLSPALFSSQASLAKTLPLFQQTAKAKRSRTSSQSAKNNQKPFVEADKFAQIRPNLGIEDADYRKLILLQLEATEEEEQDNNAGDFQRQKDNSAYQDFDEKQQCTDQNFDFSDDNFGQNEQAECTKKTIAMEGFELRLPHNLQLLFQQHLSAALNSSSSVESWEELITEETVEETMELQQHAQFATHALTMQVDYTPKGLGETNLPAFSRMVLSRKRQTAGCGHTAALSEAISLAMMEKIFDAELLHTEMEVRYSTSSPKVDYICHVPLLTKDKQTIGVSVTRAFNPRGEICFDQVFQLVEKKCLKLLQSLAAAKSGYKWKFNLLHVW
eukprot:CAMPEP_0175105810 /NCGR_PEP_ID=MMETSP0086_2-20121207/10737_1 /TAXON_ID=136419 /ORGANISM="Unknown Unknown, Strain D1" /LENGTH=472 /DNA_ID=CAMNT_0016381849 /DNA_START=679 /DNA_END=2094 /DNA_ORIENTATION=-